MKRYEISVLLGNGISCEVMPKARSVVKVAAGGFAVRWKPFDWSPWGLLTDPDPPRV